MKKYSLYILSILFFAACSSNEKEPQDYLQSDQVRLSPPQIIVEKVFFDEASSIKVLRSENEVKVRYTSDGSLPNETNPAYDQVIQVTESGTYNFLASADDFLDSEHVEVKLFKLKNIEIAKTEVEKPDEKYPGSENNLFDHEKGDFNFRSTAWKGFKGEAIINIDLQKDQEINGLIVSSLVDHNSWIFGPEEMVVTYEYSDGKKQTHTEKFQDINSNGGKAKMEFSKVTTENSKPIKISIHVKGPEAIPSWHPGAGGEAWLFLDEVVFL